MGITSPAPHLSTGPAQPVPVAFAGRTSTLVLQDPVASMRRQVRESQAKLPPGWYIAAWYWDVESGGLPTDQRGHGTLHEQLPDVGIPRDGGLADLLAEAAAPEPRFAAVICEDIERSGRDTYYALQLEKQLTLAGIPLFATDEPIDMAGANATTVLVRRVKQGVAEWFRLQIKEKAWRGLREHSLAGWNIGTPPYGYLADRVAHPVPIKAAQGRTKTRLILDPERAPAVAAIFAWRTEGKLGCYAITTRLAADPGRYPPPKGGRWTEATVYAILANPKYTGYMVFGRQRTTPAGRSVAVPPDQWLWSPEPAHPAIITRATYDTAQAIGGEHSTSRDGTGPNPHRQTRRTYVLRSRIRCRSCQRRMSGITRTSARYWADGPDYSSTYYTCHHDPANPRHVAPEGHPRTISVREDHLLDVIRQFFAERVFGPDRAALLAKDLPASAADDQARRDRQAAALNKRLRQIDAAENAHAREIEALADLDPRAPAVTALRSRVLARFTELEDERAQINAQLAALTKTAPQAGDPALLDALPHADAKLATAGPRIQQQLYQAFDLQALYNKNLHQVTIHVTITDSTPQAVAAISAAADDPAAASTPDPGHPHFSDLTQAPISGRSTMIMRNQVLAPVDRCRITEALPGRFGRATGRRAGSRRTLVMWRHPRCAGSIRPRAPRSPCWTRPGSRPRRPLSPAVMSPPWWTQSGALWFAGRRCSGSQAPSAWRSRRIVTTTSPPRPPRSSGPGRPRSTWAGASGARSPRISGLCTIKPTGLYAQPPAPWSPRPGRSRRRTRRRARRWRGTGLPWCRRGRGCSPTATPAPWCPAARARPSR
jgi:site-specific DNA recombinase